MLNLVLMGMAGSGKGTQAELLSKTLGLQAISTGNMLRDEVASGSALGQQIASIIDKGLLVSDEMVANLIQNIITQPKNSNGFILDGFPRTLNQVKLLEELLSKTQMKLDAVLLIKVDYEQLLSRLNTRFSCKKCGSVYNSKFKPTKVTGICDKCGSTEFINRNDDVDSQAVKKRFDIFQTESLPIIKFYERKNLIYSISGIGSIEDVQNRIMQILQENHIINGLRG